VTDSLTGLVWQKAYGTELTWQDAIDYCNGLDYAGQTDWRLPDYYELSSLISYDDYFGGSDFPDTPPGLSASFWSSSPLVFSADSSWIGAFYNGFMNGRDRTDANMARCVRGTGWAVDAERFQVADNGEQQTVRDLATGLLWQKPTDNHLTWQQALAYCEGLVYAGHDDWRLPNVNELRSLVNIETFSPPSDFPDMPRDMIWSSTPSGSGGHAWYVNMINGNVQYASKLLLCLRYACGENRLTSRPPDPPPPLPSLLSEGTRSIGYWGGLLHRLLHPFSRWL
jgi:hypothetical protein